MTSLLWLRRDLRLGDNPALNAAFNAALNGNMSPGAIIPVYIDDPDHQAKLPPTALEGGASQWWLYHSLTALAESLEELGNRLIVRRGKSAEELDRLIRETGATAVYWNRDLTPAGIERDRGIKQDLRMRGIEARSFNAALLHEPWQILNKQGEPYKVFSAYWRAAVATGLDPEICPPPEHLPAVPDEIASTPLEQLDLLPDVKRTGDWAAAFPEQWAPGEAGAWDRLEGFLDEVGDYAEQRDLMAVDGTSRLSPHLHFGEISPRQIFARIRAEVAEPLDHRGTEHFIRELGWREFCWYLLYHFPATLDAPLDDRFRRFAWRDTQGEARGDLYAWQRGQTGIPVIDAAMRCLWTTGWMHNRARMIVASLLTKNLLIHWQEGAAWFMDTLVDADPASNTGGWQWVAGSGADAAPYFRIFNPVLQAEKFDPDGDFIRRWVPELSALSGKALFAPWTAPKELERAGIVLGRDYPEPIVDLGTSRQRALERFGDIRNAQSI